MWFGPLNRLKTPVDLISLTWLSMVFVWMSVSVLFSSFIGRINLFRLDG